MQKVRKMFWNISKVQAGLPVVGPGAKCKWRLPAVHDAPTHFIFSFLQMLLQSPQFECSQRVIQKGKHSLEASISPGSHRLITNQEAQPKKGQIRTLKAQDLRLNPGCQGGRAFLSRFIFKESEYENEWASLNT